MSTDPRAYKYSGDVLQDRVILITGSSDGIGRALAMQLGRDGARLALSDIDHAAVQATAAAIGSVIRRIS